MSRRDRNTPPRKRRSVTPKRKSLRRSRRRRSIVRQRGGHNPKRALYKAIKHADLDDVKRLSKFVDKTDPDFIGIVRDYVATTESVQFDKMWRIYQYLKDDGFNDENGNLLDDHTMQYMLDRQLVQAANEKDALVFQRIIDTFRGTKLLDYVKKFPNRILRYREVHETIKPILDKEGFTDFSK